MADANSFDAGAVPKVLAEQQTNSTQHATDSVAESTEAASVVATSTGAAAAAAAVVDDSADADDGSAAEAEKSVLGKLTEEQRTTISIMRKNFPDIPAVTILRFVTRISVSAGWAYPRPPRL